MKFPIRHQDSLAVPIKIEKELFLVVQCQDKFVNKKMKKIFSPVDELLIKTLSTLVSLKISSILSKSQEIIELKHATQIADLASKISSCLTHKDIANRVRSVFPPYFDFESGGIVFIDNISQEFFTLIHDPNSEEFYGDQVIRFPWGMGITGYVVEKGSVSIIENPKANLAYNPEVDNVGGAHEAKNIMMGCVRNFNNKIIAVVQLVNKKEGNVSDKDSKRLESLLEMIGACVTSASISVEQFDLTIKAKKIIELIVQGLQDSDLMRTDGETALMFNQIMNLKTQFSEWAKNKRAPKR